jgi:Zn-dependent protease with chaperone function
LLLGPGCDARDLRPAADEVAHRTAEDVTGRFVSAFPDIQFDIHWESQSLNAQAYRLGERRCVALFGGLVRHVGLDAEGLAIAIAHEVGHHEGGPPFHRFYPWLSNERRADEWAFEAGLPKVFGTQAAAIAARGAPQLLRLLHSAALTHSAPEGECRIDQPCLACRAAIFECNIGLPCAASPKGVSRPSCA